MLGLQNAWLASPFGPQVTQYQPEKVPKSLVLSLSRAQNWRWSFLPVGGVAILLAVVVLLGELAVAVVAVVEVWNARAVRLLVVVGLTRSSRCSRRRSLRRRRRSGWGGSAAAPTRREELDTELRPARGHHRRFHTPLARPAAATCLGQLHLGPAPTAALWKLLLRVVPPLGPAPPRRQRASFPLHALGASDARPDPVTVAVKAVTGQRVNDMVTTRSKAKHEAPQGAAAPQGAPLPHALTSCTARRRAGRAVRFSPSPADNMLRCSVSFFTPSRGAGAPDCTERTPHRPLPGPSMPQAPVRPPGERRRSLRLRDQVHDTPGVHKS